MINDLDFSTCSALTAIFSALRSLIHSHTDGGAAVLPRNTLTQDWRGGGVQTTNLVIGIPLYPWATVGHKCWVYQLPTSRRVENGLKMRKMSKKLWTTPELVGRAVGQQTVMSCFSNVAVVRAVSRGWGEKSSTGDILFESMMSARFL